MPLAKLLFSQIISDDTTTTLKNESIKSMFENQTPKTDTIDAAIVLPLAFLKVCLVK